jgi:hypothetical protein
MLMVSVGGICCTFLEGNKNMKRTLLIMGCLAALTAVLALIGLPRTVAAADPRPSALAYPTPGTPCLVQIRPDALGQAAPSAAMPLNVNGSLRGSFKGMDNEWVVITTDKGEVFIPMRAVLLVQANPK